MWYFILYFNSILYFKKRTIILCTKFKLNWDHASNFNDLEFFKVKNNLHSGFKISKHNFTKYNTWGHKQFEDPKIPVKETNIDVDTNLIISLVECQILELERIRNIITLC